MGKCYKCGKETDNYDDKEEAAVAWNTRVNEEKNDANE